MTHFARERVGYLSALLRNVPILPSYQKPLLLGPIGQVACVAQAGHDVEMFVEVAVHGSQPQATLGHPRLKVSYPLGTGDYGGYVGLGGCAKTQQRMVHFL